MSLQLVPISFDDAGSFCVMWHRHHSPAQGHKFSIGVAEDELLVGVITVGRPVAKAYQDGRTVEATRCTTDGHRNAGSMLYAAAWTASKALGYRRLITYTEEGETGASLRAAGYRVIAQRPPRKSWDTPSRPRDDSGYRSIARTLWEVAS
jgi:hypothetical protein